MVKDKAIGLQELLLQISEAVSKEFPKSVWVTAEVLQLNANNSKGHCYMELVEKEKNGEGIVAKVQANIWSNTFRLLRPYFENVTGMKLSAGLKLMLKVRPQFTPQYGMSLIVDDIEPAYTIGDMMLMRKQIIARLQKEGVFDLNRSLPFPYLPKRLAIVSAKNAAGYGDFMKHILDSGFAFHTTLFTAQLQGSDAPSSIIEAFDEINQHIEDFDVVVLIRGGGGASDLNCFDDYNLCSVIAQFPLPVITGIGHERDEHIADFVANTNVKTPTAVADFLIRVMQERLDEVVGLMDNVFNAVNTKLLKLQSVAEILYSRITNCATQRLGMAMRQVQSLFDGVVSKLDMRLQKESHLSEKIFADICYKVNLRSVSCLHEIEMLELNILKFNPMEILKKGFTFTESSGKLLRSAKDVNVGDSLITHLEEGSIVSKVEKTIIYNNNV